MKKFNLKLITPLILTLILQGCMPDSLTKFNKDTPKKTTTAAAVSTIPVDASGQPIILTYPTVSTFNFTEANSTIPVLTKDMQVGTIQKLTSGISNITNYGSLADPAQMAYLFIKCTPSPSNSVNLPLGITLDPKTCIISGTPTVPYFNTILSANYTYAIDLFYKGPTYSSTGIESKLTATIDLGSYNFDGSGVKDTLVIDYPAIAPIGFSYTEKINGVATAVTTKDLEVGTPIEFDPKTIGQIGAPDGVGGTLSNAVRSKYIFLNCKPDTSGPLSSRTPPPGLLLNQDTCLITGTPTAAFTDTTFGNMGGMVTYKINLYYKGPTYLGPGTEVKITTEFKLMVHDKPALDPASWSAPTLLSFGLQGGTTFSNTTNFEIQATTKYVPQVDGTLISAAKFAYSFIDCTLDPTTPTLPAGILLTPSTCLLSGLPLGLPATNPNVYKINMKYKDPTYTGPGTEKTIQGTITLGVYYKPTLLTYTQHDKLLFKLDDTLSLATNIETSPYDRLGLLTSSDGITGVIKYIDAASSHVGVVKVIPITLVDATGFVKDLFIYSSGGAIGKIENVSGNTVYVERLTPALNFSAAEGVTKSAVYPGVYAGPSTTTIASIDSTYVFDMKIKSLDNDAQFYSTKYNQSSITRVYEKGVTINPISPIPSSQISALDGISYSIAPALPSGLSFDTTTGNITGQFTNTLASTSFTITATNPLGSTPFVMNLSAIEAPKDLSYTTRQLITVTSNASFNEGESLFQPLILPLTESVRGQILRKYSTNQLSISTVNGQFLEGASIDSGNAYYSGKTTVLANPIFYNIALTVSDSTSFAVNGYASSSTNALGRVVAIDTVSNTLFIQYLNTVAALNSRLLFQEGDTISSGLTYSASAVTINQVEADNMRLTLSAVPAAMLPGDDLTAALPGTPTIGDLGGYIHMISGSNIYVSDISRRATQPQSFRKTQVFDNDENMLVNRGSFTAVAHDDFVIAERGSTVAIKSNISLGTGIIYSASPTLPAGLTLNTLTGAITGVPTLATPRTTYTLSAKNLVNQSLFIFDLEVRDFFKVGENSGASSFIFHKYGDSRGSRKCSINSTDIKNFAADTTSVNLGALDVRCFLDGEEADLYLNKLKMQAIAGAGVCEYIQIYPYSFWQYAPIKTTAPYTYTTGCKPPSAAPTADTLCAGDYAGNGQGGPNCDEGSITVTTHTWSMDTATPTPACTVDTQTVSTMACGGKKTNCLRGPIRDILSDNQISTGGRSLIFSSSSGAVLSSTYSSPISNGDVTNLRVANGSIYNKCLSTNSDANLWTANMDALPDTDNPFGKGANPFYVVNCLNAAKDIKARIRIVVRDWNKTFKIKDNIDYDIPGIAMNDQMLVFGKSNNDFSDWDDDYMNAGLGANNTGTCGAPTWGPVYQFPGPKL
ncbi:MAG: Ig domain-containing protein [Bacteriovorax sp.]|nr:Ig domain-containing protein [Bacteriovorax sp.]